MSSGLGAVAYSAAALEIAEQRQAAGFTPFAIVHCSGSAGTQAGLTVGAGVCLPGASVVGIDSDAEPARVRADVVKYGTVASDLLGVAFVDKSVDVVAGLASQSYGLPHESTLEAIQLVGRLDGLVMDPVYSGKGLAGLISLIRAGRWSRNEIQ